MEAIATVNRTVQQVTGLSCGGACLQVAAIELGVDTMGEIAPEMPLTLSDACQRGIYNITAAGREGYSMPDGLARAAQQLGLGVDVYMSGCMVPRLLSWKYPAVRQALDGLNTPVHTGTPVLAQNERMLVAVGIGVLALHWVLYRPDRTYMDPAYNRNYNCSLWGMGQLGALRYIDVGVYMVVSRPDGLELV